MIKSKVMWILTLMATLQGIGMAQNTNSLLFNPSSEEFQVSVFVGRDLSGEKRPVYNISDKIKIAIRSNQDTYIYLFHINAAGKIKMLLPNLSTEGTNELKAQQTKYFPAFNNLSSYQVSGPAGTAKILALATRHKLDLRDLFVFKATMATSLVKGEKLFLKGLQGLLFDAPPKNWTADTIYYQVAGNQEILSYHNLPKISVEELGHLTKAKQWLNKYINWQTRIDLGIRLTSILKYYDNQLIAAGFKRLKIQKQSTPIPHLKASYIGQQGKKATLWIDQREKYVNISISTEK